MVEDSVELMKLHRYDEAVQYFQKISTYKDANQKIEECKRLKETEDLTEYKLDLSIRLNATFRQHLDFYNEEGELIDRASECIEIPY